IVRTILRPELLSKGSQAMHKQLFLALLIQLCIPCVLIYVPTSLYMIIPFILPNSVHSPPWLLTGLYSFYPIFDPLAIIIMISDYRKAIVRIF
ncbi:hypothetical protein PFISCL1PPCAC_3407, partial [Pristionchus fissidentatus]